MEGRIFNNSLINITQVLFATFIVIVFFSSCQKEITGEIPSTTPSSSSTEVKTYTEDITSNPSGRQVQTFNLSYDANDRIVSMVSASSPGDNFLYQYNSNNTYALDIYASNKITIHENFFLNNLSLIDSTFQFNDTNDSSTEKYLYNSKKQLITRKEYQYSTVSGSTLDNTHHYEYDNNGNMLKDIDDNSVITYEYFSNIIDNLNIGQVYISRNMNLPKTTTYTSGGYTETITHTYTFDSSNRLISEKAVAASGSVITKTYTY